MREGKASDLVCHNLRQLCQSSHFGPAISQVLEQEGKLLLLDIICILLLLKESSTKPRASACEIVHKPTAQKHLCHPQPIPSRQTDRQL